MASAQVIDMPVGDLEVPAATDVVASETPPPPASEESLEDLAGLLSRQVNRLGNNLAGGSSTRTAHLPLGLFVTDAFRKLAGGKPRQGAQYF